MERFFQTHPHPDVLVLMSILTLRSADDAAGWRAIGASLRPAQCRERAAQVSLCLVSTPHRLCHASGVICLTICELCDRRAASTHPESNHLLGYVIIPDDPRNMTAHPLVLCSGLIRSNSVDSGSGSLVPSRRGSVEKLAMPSGWAANLDSGGLTATPPQGRGRVARQLEPELSRVSGGPAAGAAVPVHSTDSFGRGSAARQPASDPHLVMPPAAQGGPGFSQPGPRGVSRQSEPAINRLLRSGSPVGKAQQQQQQQQEPASELADVGHTVSAGRGASGSQVRARASALSILAVAL